MPVARRHRAFAGAHEPHQGDQRRRLRRRRRARRDHRRACRRRREARPVLSARPAPAADNAASAATSPPTPAARAASSTASPATTCSASKSSSPTARRSALGGRTHKNKTGLRPHRPVRRLRGDARRRHRGHAQTAAAAAVPRHASPSGFGIHARRRAAAAGHLRRRVSCPRALEMADAFTLGAARKRTGSERLRGCRAHLHRRTRRPDRFRPRRNRSSERIARAAEIRCSSCSASARGNARRSGRSRREFSYALRDTGLTKLNEDIVVPRGRLEELFEFAARLAEEARPARRLLRPRRRRQHPHQHDGGLPPDPAREAPTADARWTNCSPRCSPGAASITGEHGIGLAKKPWWPQAVGQDRPRRPLRAEGRARSEGYPQSREVCPLALNALTGHRFPLEERTAKE